MYTFLGNKKKQYFTIISNIKKLNRIVVDELFEQSDYIQKLVDQGWISDVITGRAEFFILCSTRTVYRKFKANQFD